jgi:GNAT superfamily N-acetyltransferase
MRRPTVLEWGDHPWRRQFTRPAAADKGAAKARVGSGLPAPAPAPAPAPEQQQNFQRALPGAILHTKVLFEALTQKDLREATELCARAWAYDHITQTLLHEKLFEDPPGEATVALGARESETTLVALVGLSARGPMAWIKVGATDPTRRGQGLAAAMVEQAESWARGHGASTLRIMDHPGNYLTPGIDVRYAEAIEFLARRGFTVAGENRNLVLRLPPPVATRATLPGYELRRARHADSGAIEAVARRASEAWAYEVRRAMDQDVPAVHLAAYAGEPVAFAAHDGNNRGTGSFGPGWTLEAHRGKGLGRALLRACLADIAKAGHERAIIPWVSDTKIYRHLGAVEGGRYRMLVKTIR